MKLIMEDKVETENAIETAIDIETKRDIQPHNGKKIDRIIVSLDMSYAVTYSSADSSIVGWSVNIEEIELNQRFDAYFNIEGNCYIHGFVLHKNILLYRYYEHYPGFQTYTVGK